MRGFGMLSFNNTGWLEKEKPVPGPLDAILRPRIVTACTSDVHTVHGAGARKGGSVILGHEAVGEIVEVGRLVRRFAPGDLVVVPAITPDWLAPGVQDGYPAHDSGPLGGFKFTTQKDGVFGEYFHVNQADANLAALPKEINPETAAMASDMMSTGLHGVELARIGFGDSVVVVGIGPVGLMAVAGARLHGAARIFAVGTRPNCVKAAKSYGATDIINYKHGDIVEQILDMTRGKGVEAVIVAGGGQDILAKAEAMLRAGGVVANINYFDGKDILSLPASDWGLGMANKDLRGGLCPGGSVRMQKMLELIAYGRIDPSLLITHRLEGFSAIEEAYRLMEEKPADLIKAVVSINWN